MIGREIAIDPKAKTVDITVDDLTVLQLKSMIKHFKGMEDYKFRIHNPKQTTCLIDVYEGDIEIDNLMIK